MNTWMTWSAWRPAGRLFASTMIPRIALPLLLTLCAAPQAFTQAPHWAAMAGKRGSKVYEIRSFFASGSVTPPISTDDGLGTVWFSWMATVDDEFISDASADVRTKLQFVPKGSTGQKKNITFRGADNNVSQSGDGLSGYFETLSFKVKGKYRFRAVIELKKDGRIVAFSKTITVTVK